MSLLKISNLNYSIGEKTLYNDCSFVLNHKEHLGIVGKNGVGKSTLIKIITNQVSPDTAEIEIDQSIKIGYLDQYAQINQDLTILQYLQTAFLYLYDTEKKMIEAYEKSAEDDQYFEKAVAFQNILESNNFYNLEIIIEKIANGLGISALGLNKKISNLSGGQRAKVILAKLLLEKPDLLLLDEPTNFLDKEHVDWLTQYLQEFEKTFILISHNIEFLNKATTHIVEINNNKFLKFNGNYKSYLKQKDLMVDDYVKRYEKQQKQIEKTEDFIRRNIAGSNSKNARGRRKQLERMEKLPPPNKERPKPVFSFKQIHCSIQQKLFINNLSIGYNDLPLIENINLTISGGEKVVIKGFNGIGKTTLIKTLLKIIQPIKGSFEFSETIKPIYYQQDIVWENTFVTPLDIIKQNYPNLNEKESRCLLAKYGLSQKDVMQQIITLSGGEQAKVKFCLLTNKPTNFLILDEPTNHLDVQAKDSLKETLKDFEGTILLVCHEESFYKDIFTRIIDISKINK
ncbi:MAG: ATP-binding cassette domain-containing protein [Malacoplasma sp.]|nr:ATP-binding cassette domain-containing protein [Malacoplasma sp.]